MDEKVFAGINQSDLDAWIEKVEKLGQLKLDINLYDRPRRRQYGTLVRKY